MAEAVAALPDDGDGAGASAWEGDVLAGASRAALRLRHTLLVRARAVPRVSALKAGRQLDALATAADAAEALREAAGEKGVRGAAELYRAQRLQFVRAVAVPFATTAACGTVLYHVYETSADAAPAAAVPPALLPFACGALGGAAHGAAACVLSAASAGDAVAVARAHLPRAAASDGVEYAVGFGVYEHAKRQLRVVAHGELESSDLAALGLAGALAGASQAATNQLLHHGRLNVRGALRATPSAGLAFCAWELGKFASAS